ncbi:hypothetical protein RSOL_470160, partial [Rhizoctonia solani AG-3 Rhs1AP]
MDVPAIYNFSTADFLFLTSTDDQFLQFLPDSPNSHPLNFGKTLMPPYSSDGFGPSTFATIPAHGAIGITGSVPMPHEPFVPASLIAPSLITIFSLESFGDNSSQGHGSTLNCDTPAPGKAKKTTQNPSGGDGKCEFGNTDSPNEWQGGLPQLQATNHIRYLEAMQQYTLANLTASKMEVNCLQQISKSLTLQAVEPHSSQSSITISGVI